MKYYIEVTLLPNAEIPLFFLWEKVYQQVHLALVEVKREDGTVAIGVSFPGYDEKRNGLGNKLRLFSQTSAELEELAISKWLSCLMDYVHITTIRDVPNKMKGYAFFKRVQTKGSKLRLARRKAKRESISLDVAIENLKPYKEKSSKLPYIRIKSLSSERRYRLMISSLETAKNHSSYTFSTYGLGDNSFVPLF
jgi:CRISPR-associated endonuclease Csy4